MKHNTLKILVISLFFTALAGCDKYLDITPKGKTLLSTVTDYDQWLNDPSLAEGFGAPTAIFNFFGDNVDVVNISNPPTLAAELMYTWAEQFSVDLRVAPAFWADHYRKINQFNTVILGVESATGGTEGQKKSLKAEALLGRALEYFYLVNEYGKPYDSATAAQDLAVPFVTSNDVTQDVPPRSTVAEIHDRIISDLNAAIPDLPLDNSANRLRGSKAAAYSILARLYFYAGNYSAARLNAEQAIQFSRAVMMDFNGALPSSDMISIRPDVIYGRIVLGNITPTLEFMRTYASNDLRVRKLYYSADGYTFTVRGNTLFIPALVTPSLQYVNTATSLPEMKLIIAEAAARTNDLSVALQQLDDIRRNRFAAATYEPFESTDREEVLQEVLKERSHELPFSGLRFFDMRRLNRENRMGTVHRYNAQGNIIATLEPSSSRYTLQIPVQVLTFNPDMQQNP